MDPSTPTSIPGGGLSTQLGLVELAQFADVLDRFVAGLSRVADDVTMHASRPPTSAPVSFGVEAIAALSRERRGTRPTGSFVAGESDDFAINIFGPMALKFTEAEVRIAVRRVICSRYQA